MENVKENNNKTIAEKRDEREKEDKIAEDLKLVIDMAKIECKLCTNPQGILKVNLDTPTTQDKLTATVVEKDMKSLIFMGTCMKSPNSAAPCATVMQTGEWADAGTLQVQDQLPILKRSTISCNYGGSTIEITDSGQRSEPTTIDTNGAPLPGDKNATVTDAYFAKLENESFHKAKWAGIEEEIYVVVKTIGLAGKKIELNILDKDGIITDGEYGILSVLQDNEDRKGKFSVIVGNDGIAIFKLEMKPSSEDKDIKTWRDKITASKNKKVNLCILIDANKHNSGLNIAYNGKNPDSDKTSQKASKHNYWLDIQGKWFELRRKKPVIVVDPGHGYTKGNTGAVSWIYTYKLKGKDGKEVLDEKKKVKTEQNNIEKLPQYVIDNPDNWIVSTKEDPNRSERFLVHDIAKKLKQLLDDNGYIAYLTRERGPITGLDDPKTRKARIDLAIEKEADYFISVHADGANGYNSSGSHVIYPADDNAECIELAKDIFKYYNVVQVENTSPKSDVRGLQVLSQKSNSVKRKILIELGFITSPKDSKALFTNLDLIAQQIYDGLLLNINKNF